MTIKKALSNRTRLNSLLITTHCQESRHSLVFNADIRQTLPCPQYKHAPRHNGRSPHLSIHAVPFQHAMPPNTSVPPLVSELRNAFGRSARTFPLLSDDLNADLLSQSTGYVYIIAREEEKIKSFLKKKKNNVSAVCTKSVHGICAVIQSLRLSATKLPFSDTYAVE